MHLREKRQSTASMAMNREEHPFKRRRTTTTIMMLPDDLLLSCLARVSRLYYPTLSLVSKRFRSLLASKELYQTRTLLGFTESCLYVCLHGPYKPLCWFTLCRRPNSSKNILIPVSYPNFSPVKGSTAIAVGPNIYAIGGTIKKGISDASSVMVMDCRSHNWREALSMQVPRVYHEACVFDGKIYVTSSLQELDSTEWMEVFDTKTQTWEFLQNPNEEMCKGSLYRCIWYEGSLHVTTSVTTYKLHNGRWGELDSKMSNGWRCSTCYCVIENVFYRYYHNTIYWFDSKKRIWRELKGLERLSRLSRSSYVKLVDYGGKIVVLWEEYEFANKNYGKNNIWCAEIAIVKCQEGEISGMVEWFDVVATTIGLARPVVHALATTI